MSTINSPLGNRATPPLQLPVPLGTRSRLPLYLLRAGEIAAIIVFLSFCAMWVQWQMGRSGFYPISGDFVSFWTAGQLVLDGHAADAYHEMPHFFKQLALHGDTARLYSAFFYPPFFLLPCAGLALLGYFPALCVWLVSTFLCYAAAIRALLPACRFKGANPWVLFLAYPSVMGNIGFGQNGFISTALFGAAAVLLDRRPELAGVCFGCLAYKPQLGIIVPLALAVAGRWRVFFAAAATVAVLAGAATLAFGIDIWPPFLAVMAVARHNWLEAPNPSYEQFLVTPFAAVRLHGGTVLLAYTAQAITTVTAVLMLVGALLKRPRGARSGTAEVAAIAACVPFCSPFLLEYDLVILAVPMAWLLGEALRDGFRRGEGVALASAFVAPALFKITAFDYGLKLGVIAAAALLYAVVLRRLMSPAALPVQRQAPASPVGLDAATA